jgi:hypothetical protein
MYETIYAKSAGLVDTRMHYCPGYPHGIIHKRMAPEKMVFTCQTDHGLLPYYPSGNFRDPWQEGERNA